ncbi:MAG: cyd operon protein YbgE [Vibrio sp.]
MHEPINRALFRALFSIITLVHVALFMWNPEVYADHIGGFNATLALLFIWSLCSNVIFCVGFRPRFWLWQCLFSPYISGAIILYFTFLYL